MNKIAKLTAILAITIIATGCASIKPQNNQSPQKSGQSALESYNQTMYKFNKTIDKAVIKPAAEIYTKIVPEIAQKGVNNFFSNIGDAWSFVNNALQAKPEGALHSFWRFTINTTIGIGGVLDPASEMKLRRHREDLGQTLGYWGVPSGSYIVLPILGPSTLRDAIALPLDFKGQSFAYYKKVPVRNSLTVLQAVNTRANLLTTTSILSAAALDEYSFERDTFMQKRQNEVYDGNPPQNSERYDLE